MGSDMAEADFRSKSDSGNDRSNLPAAMIALLISSVQRQARFSVVHFRQHCHIRSYSSAFFSIGIEEYGLPAQFPLDISVFFQERIHINGLPAVRVASECNLFEMKDSSLDFPMLSPARKD